MQMTFLQQLLLALVGGFAAALLTSVLNHHFEAKRLTTRLQREDQRLEKQWQREREERQAQWKRERQERRYQEAKERLRQQYEPALDLVAEAVRIVTTSEPEEAELQIKQLIQDKNIWALLIPLRQKDEELFGQISQLFRYARIEDDPERWAEYKSIVFQAHALIERLYEQKSTWLDEFCEEGLL